MLTILSIHRVFPTEVKPSLETIQDPFNGLTKTLDVPLLKLALKDLGLLSAYRKNTRCSLYWSEAAGPNTVIAGFGSINDALALIHTPKLLWSVCVSLFHRWSFGFLLYLISVIVLLGPIYYLCVRFGLIRPFVNGRLSAVYNQAGKARVIAITSYWIQVCLKPLHEFLFQKLKTLSRVDGTFDQDYPMTLLIRRLNDERPKLYGFDLSAATDRLPIQLQQDILKLIGFNLPWAELLNIEWHPNFKVKGNIPEPVRYAVGQPMGALSSWAMLAVTHHVIVRCAAIRCGILNFNKYCILGDDVVIADDLVAKEYLLLMQSLGLSINRQKSVESNKFTEFAKKLRGYGGVDYSPIGAGLILQTIRSSSYCLRYTIELFINGLINLNSIKFMLKDAPKWYRKRSNIIIWTAILSTYISLFTKGCSLDLAEARMETHPLERYMIESYIDRFYLPIWKQMVKEYRQNKIKFRQELKFFSKWIWLSNVTRKGYNSVPSVFNIFNLGFYHLLISYIKDGIRLIETYCKIYSYIWYESDQRSRIAMLPTLIESMDLVSITSIKWGKRAEVKQSSKVISDLIKGAGLDLSSNKLGYSFYTPMEDKRDSTKLNNNVGVPNFIRFIP